MRRLDELDGLELDIAVPPGLPTVLAPKTELQQVILTTCSRTRNLKVISR